MGKQKQIVYEIVKQAGSQGIRTEQVKIDAMRHGISCGDRYLRWLQEENKIESCKKPDDKTFTWYICEPEPKRTFTEENGIMPRLIVNRPLSMATIQAGRKQLDLILK